MKPALGGMGAVSLVMIIIVLITGGFDFGWLSSILVADAVMVAYLVILFRIRDYRVAHVPRARAAYEALLARDKPGRPPPAPMSRQSLRVLLLAGTVAPLVTAPLLGLVLGDLLVGLAAGAILAVAGVAAWGWWLWRPKS